MGSVGSVGARCTLAVTATGFDGCKRSGWCTWVQKVRVGHKVCMGHKVSMGHKVFMGHKVPMGCKVYMGHKACMGHKAYGGWYAGSGCGTIYGLTTKSR